MTTLEGPLKQIVQNQESEYSLGTHEEWYQKYPSKSISARYRCQKHQFRWLSFEIFFSFSNV